MSIPLREGFVDESLERCLEDLLVRFVVNCPEEDLSSEERVLFQIEEAHWFYQDFLRTLNPLLPSMKMKQFTNKLIEQCPLIWKWGDPSEALAHFGKYKSTIPVRGCALLNPSMDKMLLVKGIESPSWGFPRGKISKGETDVECALRELEEETGFDASDLIDEDEFVERTIKGKNYKIFIIKGVPDDTKFIPKVRYEIVDIKWMDIKFLTKAVKTTSNYYLVSSMLKSILSFIKRVKNNESEEELKRLATIQLKKILGIDENPVEEEREDPGRALLSMLHTVAKNAQHISVGSNSNATDSEQPSTPQIHVQKSNQTPIPISNSNQNHLPYLPMPMLPNIPMTQNRMIQLPLQNPFALQMFNPLSFSNLTNSMPYPYLPQPVSNPLASQGMALAPSASSFSKPQFSLNNKRPHNINSKELLGILKSKPQPKEIINNDKKSNSSELLSLLKKDPMTNKVQHVPTGPIKVLRRESPIVAKSISEGIKETIIEPKEKDSIKVKKAQKEKIDITEPANQSTTRDIGRPLSTNKPIVLLKKSTNNNNNNNSIQNLTEKSEPSVSTSKTASPRILSPLVSKTDTFEKRQNSSTERNQSVVDSLSLLTSPNEKNNSDPSTQLLDILHGSNTNKNITETKIGIYKQPAESLDSSNNDKSMELLNILKNKKPDTSKSCDIVSNPKSMVSPTLLSSTTSSTSSPIVSPAPSQQQPNSASNDLLNMLYNRKASTLEEGIPENSQTNSSSSQSASSALLNILKKPPSSTVTVNTEKSNLMSPNYLSPVSIPPSLNGFNSFQQNNQPQFNPQQFQYQQIPMQQMTMPQMQMQQMPMSIQQMQMQPMSNQQHGLQSSLSSQITTQQTQQMYQENSIHSQTLQNKESASLLDILKGPKHSTNKINSNNDGANYNNINNNNINNNNISNNISHHQQPTHQITNNFKSVEEFQNFEDYDDCDEDCEYLDNGGLYDD